jgi:hypothetical protein
MRRQRVTAAVFAASLVAGLLLCAARMEEHVADA